MTLWGCGFHPVETGPLQEDPVKLELGKVERANVELNMGAGEMIVHPGATDLLNGKIEYNVVAMKPNVQFSVVGSHGTVTISQPEHANFGGNPHYVWDLKLNDKVLVELAVKCGAGRAQLELGDLRLRQLQISMGAGQVDLDLRGKPREDYDVNISGGVGQATIHLPQGVGVSAEAHGGLGSISVTGLEKRGDHYENDLYDKAKVNIRIKVEGGIGNIQIIG
jgi:N-terminal domain of toast_rack, DUF2154